jgi:hypothetical protein
MVSKRQKAPRATPRPRKARQPVTTIRFSDDERRALALEGKKQERAITWVVRQAVRKQLLIGELAH